jgi:peptidoglycan/LPS O-acetylase OafA/YrhL
MKVYFPGLNGLRAIAASIVIFFHINSTMWFFGATPINYFGKREEMSRHAVVLFFVLSGFLITYLLIKEKERFKKIDVKKFYIRRILRIWPVYYAAILLSLFLIPAKVYEHSIGYSMETIVLYALFIPNFAMMAGYMLPTISPLWSVGIEEQFYALWPLILNRTKNIFGFLLFFLFGYIALKVILVIVGQVWSPFSISLNFFSYDTLSIGGIAAYLYASGSKLVAWLYHPFLQMGCWLFFAFSCIFGPLDFHYIINKEVYSIVYAVLILNVATNPLSIIRINGKMFDFLGKISYGMYVFHPFVIVLTAIPLKYVIPHLPGKPFQFIAISLVVVPITILVSKLSFVYFESRFLKLKGKYSNIDSTNEQKQTKIKPKERAAIV